MPPTSPPPFPPQSDLDDLLADDLGSGHATSSSHHHLLHHHAHAHTPGSTAAAASSSSSASKKKEHLHQLLFNPPASRSSPAAARSVTPEDIEMGSIPAGHRRRRSSLMNGVTPSRTGGPRQHSQSRSIHLHDEPKISEEGTSLISGPGRSGPGRSGGSGGDYYHSDDDRGGGLSDEDLRDDEETGLTRGQRDRRKWKKRRNTLLDQRIVPEKITKEEKKEADQGLVKTLAINVALILSWYVCSLGISLYNKWMFDQDRLNFKFPLITTAAHMVIQFCLASIVLYFVPSLRPQQRHGGSDLGRSRHEAEPSQPSQPIMSKWFYLTRIAPCGIATGLDIGLGNTSLQFITLTFYTMCKSSALAFVLMFAFLFRLEAPTIRLVGIIAVMTAGVVMMVFGEVKFHLGGFILIMSAAFFSGFRWALTQILLLRNPATSNPFSSIFFLSPVMFVALLSLGLLTEGIPELFESVATLQEERGTYMAPAFLLFPGAIAFVMTASEFALLKRTSVVTLSIAGIFKEVVTISAAALVFDDRLTFVNFIGLLITMAAIVAYNWFKISKMRREAQQEVHRHHHMQSRSPSSSSPHNSSSSDAEVDEAGEEAVLLKHHGLDMSERGRSPGFGSSGDER